MGVKRKVTREELERLKKKYESAKAEFQKTRSPEAFRKTARLRGVLSACTRSVRYGTLVDEDVIKKALADP
jgi:hypothetical protein